MASETASGEYGFIYSVQCKPTGKYYIGQAKEFKYKNGKPFRYGIKGRWSDHVSSAKCGRSGTPFAEAIQLYGAVAFELKELQMAPSEELDIVEAFWIREMNTIVPNGYNVCAHANNHSLVQYYQGRVEKAVLRPVRRDGQYALMYVMLSFLDKNIEIERLTFGQKKDGTFEEAREEALAFVRGLECPFMEETSNSLDPLERYASKLKLFEGRRITRIRITTASKLVAVYVTCADAKSYKDQVRICFGGKVVPEDVAYGLALEFVNALEKNETTILEDQYRGRQQVAAPKVETEP
jgi:hypothetical protein